MAKSNGGKKLAESRGSTYGTIHKATPMKLKLLTFAIIITGLSVCFWEEFSETRHHGHNHNVRASSPGAAYFQNRDGLWLHTESLRAASPAKGSIFLVHGYGNHCGRYMAPFKAAQKAGYDVHCVDHQGFGKSDGERAHVESFDDYVEDYAAFMKKTGASKNVFVVGNSMGGLIAARLLQRGVKADGAVFIAPAMSIKMDVFSRVMKPLLPFVASIFPKFPISEMDRTQVNANPENAASFMADPLTYKGPYKAKASAAMLEALDVAHAEAGKVQVPALFMLATDDRVCPHAGNLAFVEQYGAKDKTVINYEGAWHALLADPRATTGFNDALSWISQHTH